MLHMKQSSAVNLKNVRLIHEKTMSAMARPAQNINLQLTRRIKEIKTGCFNSAGTCLGRKRMCDEVFR